MAKKVGTVVRTGELLGQAIAWVDFGIGPLYPAPLDIFEVI